MIGRPRRRYAWRDDAVEPVAVEGGQQPLLPGQPACIVADFLVGRVGERPLSPAPARTAPVRKKASPFVAWLLLNAIKASSDACGDPLAFKY
jgi:hypothetical protein